jgi:hypothetical protein
MVMPTKKRGNNAKDFGEMTEQVTCRHIVGRIEIDVEARRKICVSCAMLCS